MPQDSTATAEKEVQKANEEKWSKTLMAAGWTAIPSVILEKQHALGLDAIDMNIIAHLTIYWWKRANLPRPSVATIAKAVGVKPRTIQKHLKKMEDDGFITRHQRRRTGQSNNTNLYSFDGLIKAVTPFAQEKIDAMAQRQQQEAQRVARKKPTLAVVK
ncbi:helix-turn-helix domain-containing protein [Bradyrhizobium sp.]|uniref:helix-turn-helix domain-containing protein n=1 Tax=Bradyrhizobium sp. TaxID=376 RepID=UPI001ED49C09|nr:helix-turn-helix domain-containing protein [Bradyrhizobium sp.]MBV8891613.1 MarR family transcriptional regulator [Acidobacteriota bacterium]MBV9482819.1 MarR family transcriptional regulator [Acidobacteriota bacterium]MBV9978959.1 MarR family transcriptional regulator [Bradyrhizobium sp.]